MFAVTVLFVISILKRKLNMEIFRRHVRLGRNKAEQCRAKESLKDTGGDSTPIRGRQAGDIRQK